eukprot:TRINITY_DN7174_c0_g1_i1.p1 TRINITY_DN7174_c0_g1~~TRINITY_DN7174_c0_g1_i1.p1  ORF type:complete len:483 (+),score=102.42 TRINITY_DN7174_c0_g1_i1:1170-2618(+)
MLRACLLSALILEVRAGSTTPEQIHLALSGKNEHGYSTGYRVAWFTEDSTINSTVQYGLKSSGELSQSACNLNGPRQYLGDHGYHHVAEMTLSMPGEEYLYRVGNEEGGWSSVFTTKAPITDPEHSFGVSVFGDMGWLGSKERPMVVTVAGLKKNWTAVPTRQVMEDLKNEQAIDMVWHLGDIGYADDAFAHHPAKMSYEEAYNGYMNWLQNVTSTVPYMVAAGNHESECHSPACLLDDKVAKSLSNFSAYNTRWHMPADESNGVLNMWYSFNHGPVHFVSINSETDFPGAGEENTGDSHDPFLPAGHFAPEGAYLRWLEEDLRKAQQERGMRPWILAGGHRPYDEIKGNGVAELFEKYGVDMYFAGHAHSYARSMPINTAGVDNRHTKSHVHNANGTVMIVAGGPGCDEMPDVGFATDWSDFEHDMDAYGGPIVPSGSEVYATGLLASGLLNVVNRTALHFQLIGSYNHSVLDELWLTKDL